MTTATGTRAERRVATMTRIIDEAWQLSRERGLAGWTLRDLGSQVGMRAPSLYVYVDSKFALYDALYADGYRALLDVVVAIPRDQAPLEALREGAHRFVEFCVANGWIGRSWPEWVVGGPEKRTALKISAVCLVVVGLIWLTG